MAFRSVSSNTGTAASDVTVAKPAGVVDGDWMIAVLGGIGSGAGVTPPAGWTVLSNVTYAVGLAALRQIVYYRVADGEGADYTWSFTSSPSPSIEIGAWSGIDPDASIDVSAVQVDATFGTTFSFPSVTTTRADDTLIFASCIVHNADNVVVAAPSGTTTRLASNWNGNRTTLLLADQPRPTAAATGVKTATSTLGSMAGVAVTVALRRSNRPPDAVTPTNPVGGAIVDLTATNRFTWPFSDPDTGDTQSSYQIRYQAVGAGAWTTLTAVASPNQYHDFGGGTFTADDYEWQVRTADTLGEWGDWGPSAFFTAAEPPDAPTFTHPISGATIGTNTYTAVISAPTVEASRWRTVADDAGSPDTSIVYTDTTYDPAPARRAHLFTFDTNERWEHLQAQTKQGGLWSAWASVRNYIDFTEPATPIGYTIIDDDAGTIDITAVNPAATGDQPDVTSNTLLRRVTGSSDDYLTLATGVPANGSFVDRTAASGVTYDYVWRAVGDNDTTTDSAIVTGRIVYTSWWLRDPLDASLDRPIAVRPGWQPQQQLTAGVFYPRGRNRAIVATGEVYGIVATLNILTLTAEEDAAVMALLTSKRTLLLQSVLGEQWWVRVTGPPSRTMLRSRPEIEDDLPLRHAYQIAVPIVEVDILWPT